MIYSANYLLRTSNVRWAIDPVTLQNRLRNVSPVDVSALQQLSFILLTHRHADHLDLSLIKALSHFDIHWVIPQDVLEIITVGIELPRERVHIPKFGEAFQIDGIQILPFQGIHWERDNHGVPATSYLVTFNGKRWLFPGDIRLYEPDLLPELSSIDGIFAHIWLGRGRALLDEPLLLSSFCNFYLNLHPKQIVITHMQEFGRSPEDYWESRHCEQVKRYFRQVEPRMQVICVSMGESVRM